MPCCDQAICEGCQSTLPASCPVCEHSPLSADDCKAHKALRTTIKVFLRTEEKKRESNRPKEATPITPVDPSPVSATAPVPPELNEQSAESVAPAGDNQEQSSSEAPAAAASVETSHGQENGEAAPGQNDETLEHDAADSVSFLGLVTLRKTHSLLTMIKDQPSHPALEGEGVGEATSTELVKQEGTEVAEGEETEEVNGEEGDGNGNDQEQNADGTAKPVTGGFGMGFGGNFEQMPMMMAMNNGFGSFPMMGQSNFTCV